MPDVNHRDSYFTNSDIDWFCRVNGVNIHVASMGHAIPERVMQSLPAIYEKVSVMEMAAWTGRNGMWYNEELLRTMLRLESPVEMGRYLTTFVVMARKGFYSFAPLTTDPTDNDYYLMAKPAAYKDFELNGIVSKNVEHIEINEVGTFTPVRIVELISQGDEA